MLWRALQSSGLWKLLRKSAFLRSGLYLAIEMYRTVREPRASSAQVVDRDFTQRRDPWKYETDALEKARYLKQTELLDELLGAGKFGAGLEIGCAEGLYTETLADRCEMLLVLDLSPTALERARSRCVWPDGVHFSAFDLRSQPIPGAFDLIVLAGVLEYFNRPSTFFKIREKLAGALQPGGYLLLETTRVNPVVENAWWGRRLMRGKWINMFVAEHPSLVTVTSVMTDAYSLILCRKSASGGAK